MKNLLKIAFVFALLGLTFSCNKEDIRPKEDTCTCQSIEGKNGNSNCNNSGNGTVEPPITDPNNDEDENKVVRKTTKS
jgi:hypothetical protein